MKEKSLSRCRCLVARMNKLLSVNLSGGSSEQTEFQHDLNSVVLFASHRSITAKIKMGFE
jgi:hypothetical protein